jgi:ATP-dependent DNA helicase RecG
MLVMTATPIPRTLALTLYGDLDVSTIDEMPPGRQPIETRLLEPVERAIAYQTIRTHVASGRQAFIICPLIQDNPNLEVRAATEEYHRLQAQDLAGLRLALLHGRMRSQEKDKVMRAFRDGEYDVLVSTAVVEVGVDVPNATVMLIEGAERFGLSQLHQFRGRVGRGSQPAICLLQTEQDGLDVRDRLKVMEQSSNGLELAERDLELRGPGEFFGVRQSGFPDLRMARLSDTDLIGSARRAAQRLLAEDPELEQPEYARLRERVERLLGRGGNAG